jgi:hypothetical protein
MPGVEAARLVAEVARAVAYAHEQGVLHRDLKPANIILETNTGRPRVTDFGLARDRSLARSLTRSGDVVGTPAYAAPEQLRGDKTVDGRADVYALGVILYECVTGRRPFVGANVVELGEAVLRGRLRPPRELLPALPEALDAIVVRALARERDQRTPSARALTDELDAFVESQRPAAKAERRGVGAPVVLGAAGLLAASVLAAGVFIGRASRTGGGDPAAIASAGPAPATEPAPSTLPTEAPAPATATPPPATTPPTTTPPPTTTTVPAPPKDELTSLLDGVLDALDAQGEDPDGQRAVAAAMSRASALLRERPDDSRAQFLASLVDFLQQQGRHHGRGGWWRGGDTAEAEGTGVELRSYRGFVRALALSPPLPARARGLIARYAFTLGFQRVAREALEGPRPAEETERDVASARSDLAQALVKSLPPVQDLRQAVQLCREIAPLTDRLGTASVTHLIAGDALAHLGETVDAEAEYRAMNPSHPDAQQFVSARLDALHSGALAPPLDGVPFAIGGSRLLQSIVGIAETSGQDVQPIVDFARAVLDDRALDAPADPGMTFMAMRMKQAQPAMFTLLCLAVARLLERTGAQRAVEVELLTKALALVPDDAPEVRALLGRVLARQVLPEDPARARQLARQAASLPPRVQVTPGEQVDAWVIYGQACRALKDDAGVAEALREASALRPADTRELDLLRPGR